MGFGRLAVAVKADFVVDDFRTRTVLVAEVELSTSVAKRFRAGVRGSKKERSEENVSAHGRLGNPLELESVT